MNEHAHAGGMHQGVETWDTECGSGVPHWASSDRPMEPEERGYGAPEQDGSGAGNIERS